MQLTHRAAVNIIALRLPNVDAATNSGIHQDIQPSMRSANVYTDRQTDILRDTETYIHAHTRINKDI